MKQYKLKRLPNTYGINAHQNWEATFPDGHKVIVRSNEDVLGDKWYLTNGEGTDTIWYSTKEKALESLTARKGIERR